jgi:ABC-2 type transport system ATP-binding protein
MSSAAAPLSPARDRSAAPEAADVRDMEVEAEGLAFGYRGRRALDGVSFAVPRGAVFGFLGPNGSGKTTLFRLLATLLPLQDGRAAVAGHDLAAEPLAVRRALGVAFQAPSLDLRLTVEENLRHHGHLYGLRGGELARRIGEGLDRFALADRRRDRAESLSGGLRRRVELAKTLLHRPRVLLLDEPSTGLDPRARRELWDVLAGLAGEGGVTVLLTTHFIEEAERCDRLLLLDRGRVVAEGTPEALCREVGGEVVRLATEAPGTLAAELEEALAAIGTAARPEVEERGVRLELPRHAGGTGAAWETVALLARRLPGWEERVAAVTVARPTLEDVFLHRTGRRLDEDPADVAAETGR